MMRNKKIRPTALIPALLFLLVCVWNHPAVGVLGRQDIASTASTSSTATRPLPPPPPPPPRHPITHSGPGNNGEEEKRQALSSAVSFKLQIAGSRPAFSSDQKEPKSSPSVPPEGNRNAIDQDHGIFQHSNDLPSLLVPPPPPPPPRSRREEDSMRPNAPRETYPTTTSATTQFTDKDDSKDQDIQYLHTGKPTIPPNAPPVGIFGSEPPPRESGRSQTQPLYPITIPVIPPHQGYSYNQRQVLSTQRMPYPNDPSRIPRPSLPQHHQQYPRSGYPPLSSAERSLLGPPPRYTPYPVRRQPPVVAALPSTWKKLWRNVEKSLDGLADLENVVSQKASELYSTTLDTVKAPLLQKPRTNTGRPIAHHPGRSLSPPKQDAMDIAFKKKPAPQNTPSDTTEISATTPVLDPVKTTVTRKNSEWNKILLGNDAVSNGGASDPSSDEKKSSPFRDNLVADSIEGEGVQTVDVRKQFSMKWEAEHDDDDSSWKSRLGQFLPSMPSFSLFTGRRDSFNEYSSATMDAWKVKEEKESSSQRRSLFRKRRRELSGSEPTAVSPTPISQSLLDLKNRLDRKSSVVLLSGADEKACIREGRRLALFDCVGIACLMVLLKYCSASCIHFYEHHSLSDIVAGIPRLFSLSDKDFLNGWIPFLLAGAILATETNKMLLRRYVGPLAKSVSMIIEREAQHGALFVRLLTNKGSPTNISGRIASLSSDQVHARVFLARMRSLLSVFLSIFVPSILGYASPLIGVLWGSLVQAEKSHSLRQWPLVWNHIRSDMGSAFSPVKDEMIQAVEKFSSALRDHPTPIVYAASVVSSIAVLALVPFFEYHRRVKASLRLNDDDEAIERYESLTFHIRDLGLSSASRLPLLASKGNIESILEKWRLSSPDATALLPFHSLKKNSRVFVLRSVVLLCALAPLYLFRHSGEMTFQSCHSGFLCLNSWPEISLVLLVLVRLAFRSIKFSADAAEKKESAIDFLRRYSSEVDHQRESQVSENAALQTQSSLTPSSGIQVRDLWAAHNSRRAWAARGINLSCRKGEVVLILGEDGSGKSRILTSLAEVLLQPGKNIATTTKARGIVSVAGLEASKWNQSLLRRKIGIFLSDTDSVSNLSKVLSGCTLEEILDPEDIGGSSDHSRKTASSLALQMSGLGPSILQKLPSKWNTVLTSVEEDMRSSSMSPRAYLLSPSEWSKLLLSRTFARVIYNSENTLSDIGRVENCLAGSILLLDDPLVFFSDTDESKFFNILKSSGASSLVTSSRWSLGRFADKIVVIRDGMIVESGTHNELLQKNPQESIYAGKWQAMTS